MRKCWRFGHTDEACSRQKSACPSCGVSHEYSSSCQVKECVNCKVRHPSKSKTCPSFKKIAKSEKDAADPQLKPQVYSFSWNMYAHPNNNNNNFSISLESLLSPPTSQSTIKRPVNPEIAICPSNIKSSNPETETDNLSQTTFRSRNNHWFYEFH